MSVFEGFIHPQENWSKLPHQLVNSLDKFTSLSELKIVLYVLRHTWGFKDDAKTITLDEFQFGRKRNDGTRLDSGIGMTKPTIISGIKRAIEHGFICVESSGENGQVQKSYSLNQGGLKSLTGGVKKFYP